MTEKRPRVLKNIFNIAYRWYCNCISFLQNLLRFQQFKHDILLPVTGHSCFLTGSKWQPFIDRLIWYTFLMRKESERNLLFFDYLLGWNRDHMLYIIFVDLLMYNFVLYILGTMKLYPTSLWFFKSRIWFLCFLLKGMQGLKKYFNI